jgi:uncharacterized protein YaaQ
MQLIVAIVQDEDADLVARRFDQAGLSLTRLRSRGGFLASGNVTLLAGVAEEQVQAALDIFRGTCQTRRRYINPTPAGAEPAHLALTAPAFPLEVEVGGATIFQFPVKRFGQFPSDSAAGSAPSPLSDRRPEAPPVMNLVLAIVPNEDADPLTQALIGAGYRVTRMNTAGGFLRRGNVTLMVGVEEAQVDAVLELIRSRSRPAGADAAGQPAPGVTVFVLEASGFARM